MRYIKEEINHLEMIINLEEVIRNHNNHRVRKRAMAIKLNIEQKISIPELEKITGVKSRAIYDWFDRFDEIGIFGLFETKGRGRKRKIKDKKN